MSQAEETTGERSTVHSTFALERTYEAAPARVWQAWADPAEKRRWFGPPEPAKAEHELDFRVGGLERMTVQAPVGAYKFIARFQDIVEGERFVHTYEMYLDDARISVSVATVVFEAAGDGATKLTMTEQGVFLDDLDTPAAREHGTGELLDTLGSHLQSKGDVR
jgi:uncharacterized protein YndB with AHSA1/START domain